jgi:hypothetical protein
MTLDDKKPSLRIEVTCHGMDDIGRRGEAFDDEARIGGFRRLCE